MALRLFRTTGYSTLLAPGEARLALHPAWMVLAISAWLALPANVAIWRLADGADGLELRLAAGSVLAVGGGSYTLLSLLGWRRTFKFAATLLLLAGALASCGLWVQGLPLETLWQQRPRGVVPGWASFISWQVPTLMLLLAVLPIVWVWHATLRRLPGPTQLRVNLGGALAGAVVFGGGFVLLN